MSGTNQTEYEVARSVGGFNLAVAVAKFSSLRFHAMPFGILSAEFDRRQIPLAPDFTDKNLGFRRLDWDGFYSTALRLYCGAKWSSGWRPSLGSTLGTIEIVRKADSNSSVSGVIEGAHTYKDTLLRMAGVDSKSNRVVAATYDLSKALKPLTEVNISFSSGEIPALTNPDEQAQLADLVVDIPTKLPEIKPILPNEEAPDFSYTTAGLITEGMVGLASYLSGTRQDQAIVLKTTPDHDRDLREHIKSNSYRSLQGMAYRLGVSIVEGGDYARWLVVDFPSSPVDKSVWIRFYLE